MSVFGSMAVCIYNRYFGKVCYAIGKHEFRLTRKWPLTGLVDFGTIKKSTKA